MHCDFILKFYCAVPRTNHEAYRLKYYKILKLKLNILLLKLKLLNKYL